MLKTTNWNCVYLYGIARSKGPQKHWQSVPPDIRSIWDISGKFFWIISCMQVLHEIRARLRGEPARQLPSPGLGHPHVSAQSWMRFGVFNAVKLWIVVFCIVTFLWNVGKHLKTIIWHHNTSSGENSWCAKHFCVQFLCICFSLPHLSYYEWWSVPVITSLLSSLLKIKLEVRTRLKLKSYLCMDNAAELE
jgi:hypothetical protein